MRPFGNEDKARVAVSGLPPLGHQAAVIDQRIDRAAEKKRLLSAFYSLESQLVAALQARL